jgi:FkbM family methyltransferase
MPMNTQETSTVRPFAAVRSTLRPVRQAVTRIFRPSPPFSVHSYSQDGEDMLLRSIFEGQSTGFYVDVGAHHPQRFSNTHYFYLSGWRGMNIDAMPGSMEPFLRLRPRDVNLEIGVSDSNGMLTYFAFNDSALNGFSKEIADRITESGQYHLEFTKPVPTRPLAEILDEYLPANQTIDFLTVDVEGLDDAVLRSNNWEKYRPRVILMEAVHLSPTSGSQFLRSLGYREVCSTLRTQFYCREDFSTKRSWR